MTLAAGTRLGPHEILSAIGAGGMGEVYKATDTNLKRAVAIKVLPALVAGDPERLARFQREAEVLAALNHPNIAAIYGLERSGITTALVMELVEGPTLADRIADGPIPIDEALSIAKQIAESLEAAHEQGIIHRDLKPANIKLRPDGAVKVLDFGLAKAIATKPIIMSAAALSNSPTIPSPVAATAVGVLLGTAAYMSPEQARGKRVDRRTDLWAFGCVLFEMLSGHAAFRGETVTDVLAAVVTTEPLWADLPADTPLAIRRLLARCMIKDTKARLADASTARLEIEDALRTPHDGATPAPIAPTASRERLAWIVTVATTIAAIVAVVASRQSSPPQSALPEVRFEIPDASGDFSSVSPDGSLLIYLAQGADGQHWAVRTLATGKAAPLPSLDVASSGFWSPDGRSLAFMADRKLKRLDLASGAVQTLADAPTPRGGSWGSDDTILFALSGNGPIYRIPATGGTPQPVTELRDPQASHRYPIFLPDGRHFLFWVMGPSDVGGEYVGSLDNPAITRLIGADGPAAFAAPDQVLFFREGVLYGQSLDVREARMVGDSKTIASGFRINATGPPRVSASRTGVVAFHTDAETRRQIEWVDRAGTSLQTIGPIVTDMGGGSLSPDGRTIAIVRRDRGGAFIWLMDVSRGTLSRFSDGGGLSETGVMAWSPDSSRLAFNSVRDGFTRLYWQRIGGNDTAEVMFKSTEAQNVSDWSPDGGHIVFSSQSPVNSRDLWSMPVTGTDRTPRPFVVSANGESGGSFSPDGKWFAYESNEDGQTAVFVRAFPGPGRAWRVSTGAGFRPFWRADGRELYYLAGDQLMAVPVNPIRDTLELGAPTALFSSARTVLLSARTEGLRFLVARLTEDVPKLPLTVVLNWNRGGR